jgi:hypothetical protein
MPRPPPSAADGEHLVVADPGGTIRPAELAVSDHLAVMERSDGGLWDVLRPCQIDCDELFVRPRVHRCVAVVGDVRHRFADDLPDTSGQLWALGERRQGDPIR